MLTCIVDLQYGSTGKGLLAGYLSQKRNYDVVVSANMPNAGHTFVDSNGLKWINKVLPSGVYSPQLEYICIGPGAVFDPHRLSYEIQELLHSRNITAKVVIHPDAAILLPTHKHAEEMSLSPIASTMQGSMEASFHKMRRHTTGANTASHNHAILLEAGVWDYVVGHDEYNMIMLNAKNVLAEGSQGFSLGINAGFYPYCTSRDCTVWRLISDTGVMPQNSEIRVIGTARVHPIRVGNTPDGNSGNHYPDQEETSWEELGVEPEYTTVTKRVRRVFTFSHRQIREAILANKVDEVFLNFCNYDGRQAIEIKGQIDKWGQDYKAKAHPFAYAGDFPPIVRYMGFGPQAEDVLDVGYGRFIDGPQEVACEPV
jgi:adenylosuccinate synthase